MKKIALLILFLIGSNSIAQEHVNLKKGYAAEGYDVVSYFSNEAKKGMDNFTTAYKGINYQFSSQKNLSMFTSNPEQYIPQYGGFCAYAIAVKGEKVGVNPKTFQVVDGKLYLFYNSWGVNTLDKWNEENPEALLQQANTNWKDIVKKGD